jgi:anthranilate/para-aminobenzoate synthase component II
MKTLIVDNGSIHIENLARLAKLNNCEITQVSYRDIPKNLDAYEVVILSGSSDFNVNNDTDTFVKEIDLIKSGIPVIGICFGFELIVKAFGQDVTRLRDKVKGTAVVNKLSDDAIFNNIENLEVFEAHRYGVEKIESPLISLAESEFGIEIIKHEALPIYGLQFHPEELTDKLTGDELFTNILEALKRSQQLACQRHGRS